MNTEPLKTATFALGVALFVFFGGLVGVGAVSVVDGDALFEDDEPSIVMVPHDGPGGQYVVESEGGELQLDFTDPGLTRNTQFQFSRVFDLVNQDDEAVIVWVSHDNQDVLRLYDDATGETIAGRSNAVVLEPGERVVVSVDIDSRGVTADELVTTVTFAAEFDIPFFEVEIVDIDEEVVAGETISAEATVENVGNAVDEREVRFLVDGETVDTANVTLDPDESRTLTFEYETTVDDSGDRSVAVETDDDRDEREVAVEPAEDPFFDVTIDDIPEEVDVGDQLIVGATIENLGQASETQTIELVVDGEVVDDQTVELGGSNPSNSSIELTWTPREGDEGTDVPIAVRSGDDEDSTTVDVNPVFRAQASASSYAVTVGTEVELRAGRSITPPDVTPSFSWEVDGEHIGDGETVSTVLSEPGEREVTLTMTGGGETDTDTIEIDVSDEEPPSIDLSVDDSVPAGDSITFDASGTEDDVEIESFEWDFGDGTTGSGEAPDHVYDEPGRYTATLTVTDSSGNEATARVEILVRGPRGSISTDEIDFGEVGTGSTSSDTVVVTNTGTTPLEMSAIRIDGSDAFELLGDAVGADGEMTVEPGDSRTIEIAFAPNAGGDESATLRFDSNYEDLPGAVSLSGAGLEGDLKPVESRVGFGDVAAGESQQRTVTVENVGDGAIDLTGAELTGPDANAFEIVDGGDATLGPNETHDITVAFEPTAAGDRTANLRVVSEGSTVTVALRGSGQAPRIRLDRESIAFPTVGLGNAEDATVEIRNGGNRPLEIDDIEIDSDGPGSEHFWVDSDSVPETVSPGETETFDVWFEPQADGDHEATLSIESNDPEEPTTTMPISGPAVGAEISINQRTLDFGTVDPDEAIFMNVTIRNKQNSPADLRINATDIVGGDVDAFFVNRGGAPITLSPGETHDIEIGFEPLDRGNKNSQLQILSDAGNRPIINVWLSNTRAYIMVQEIGNPTINVEGHNLIKNDDYDLNVWTPTVDSKSVGFRQLRFTSQRGNFEMNVEHSQLDSEVAPIEASGKSTLEYVQLEHFDMEDPDETYTGTGIRYQVRKTNIPSGADPDEVTLYRWNYAGEWVNLSEDTELVDETDTHYVYAAETPGFSQFAVTVPSRDDPSQEEPSSGPSGDPGGGSEPTTPSEEAEESPEEDDSDGIRTDVDFRENEDIPTFQAREVSSEEVYELDRATADVPPRALILPRGERGKSIEEDRTVTIGGRPATLSAERTRIMTAGEPIELSGERSTLSSGDAIADRDRMIGAVEISVPESRRDQPATVRLRVDRERFGDSDPREATIGHRTDGGWELLETEVVDATDDEVVLSAETPGFSIFGIFADPQVQYQWTLPDGTTADGPVLNHTFAEPGLYEVELRITDAFSRQATASYQVLANDVPEATIEVVDREGDEVTLAANVDDEIGETDVTWTFPDGTEMTGEEVTHTLEDGEHEIELHVVDEFGAESRIEETIALGTLSRAVADALGIDLGLLVQLSLLSIISGVLAAGYRRFPTSIFTSVARRGPEITIFETPFVDTAAGQFVIETLAVVDGGCELETITIEVTDDDGVLLRKQLDVSGRTEYSASPETLVIPPGVELDPDVEYTVHVEAIDTNGRRVGEYSVASRAISTAEEETKK